MTAPGALVTTDQCKGYRRSSRYLAAGMVGLLATLVVVVSLAFTYARESNDRAVNAEKATETVRSEMAVVLERNAQQIVQLHAKIADLQSSIDRQDREIKEELRAQRELLMQIIRNRGSNPL